MKRTLFCLTLIMIMVSGCKQAKNEKTAAVIDKESRETPDFSKGVMDEKILWYLGRLGDVQVSPDGQTLLYTVTYYDYHRDGGERDAACVAARRQEDRLPPR